MDFVNANVHVFSVTENDNINDNILPQKFKSNILPFW